MKRYIIIFIIIFIISPYIFAGGESGADILQIKPGGRAIGLGGAYTATGNDVESINYNPAGLADVKKKEIEYMYWFSYADIGVHYITYAQPFETVLLEGKAGISFIYRFIPDINNEDASDEPVTYYDYVLTGTYANSLSYFLGENFNNILFGVNFKIIGEQLNLYQGSTFAFDIGLKILPPKTNLEFGISLQNIGVNYKIIEEEVPLPFTIRLGSSYNIFIDKNNKILFALDWIQDIINYGKIAFGFEYNLLDMFFLRTGFEDYMASEYPSVLSLGSGLSVAQFEISLTFNYVLKLMLWNGFKNFDATHIFSFALKL